MPTCRACDAEVVFVPSAKSGKRMILDAKPTKGVVVTEHWDDVEPGTEPEPGTGEMRAVVVDVYTDHHATCTDPGRFR